MFKVEVHMLRRSTAVYWTHSVISFLFGCLQVAQCIPSY